MLVGCNLHDTVHCVVYKWTRISSFVHSPFHSALLLVNWSLHDSVHTFSLWDSHLKLHHSELNCVMRLAINDSVMGNLKKTWRHFVVIFHRSFSRPLFLSQRTKNTKQRWWCWAKCRYQCGENQKKCEKTKKFHV